MMCSTLYVPGLWMIPLMRAAGKLRALVVFEVASSTVSLAGMVAMGAVWGITGVAIGRVLFTVVLILCGGVYILRRRATLFSHGRFGAVPIAAQLRVEPT